MCMYLHVISHSEMQCSCDIFRSKPFPQRPFIEAMSHDSQKESTYSVLRFSHRFIEMASKAQTKGSLAAKKMAAGVKNMWDYAKRDFTENAPQVKQDFMDMLDYAKHKSQMLKRPSLPGPAEINTQLERSVNIDVGGDLLTHFKEEWSAIHFATHNSGVEATRLDSEIAQICDSLSQGHTIIQRCHDEFSQLPETITAIQETQNKVNSLGELLQKLEESITEYARVKSQLESERKLHSIRIQYEKHCVEGDSKVEQLKNILAHERQETIDQKKKLATRQLQERQNTFQSMFNEQMAEYREKGSVERPISGEDPRERAGSSLEEVVIDDKDGSASLSDFLSDVVMEELENKETEEEEEGTDPVGGKE